MDFPDVEITEEIRRTAMEQDTRYSTSNMRLATGRFYTQGEYETRRTRVLSTPLP